MTAAGGYADGAAFAGLIGSRTGTWGELLMTLGLPSVWLRACVLISDSKIRKNFSASMAWPRWRRLL